MLWRFVQKLNPLVDPKNPTEKNVEPKLRFTFHSIFFEKNPMGITGVTAKNTYVSCDS